MRAPVQEVRAHPFSAAHPLVGELMAASQQQQAAAAAGGAGAGGSRSLSLEGKRSVKPRVGEASQAQAYQRRLVPRCTDLMYICDGDQNGVIHHIATQYGTKVCVGRSRVREAVDSLTPITHSLTHSLDSLRTSLAHLRTLRSGSTLCWPSG